MLAHLDLVPLQASASPILWGGFAFGAVFLGVFVVGVGILIQSLRRRAAWPRTQGAITGWDHSLDHSRPIVEWTVDGRRYERTVHMGDFGWYPEKPVTVWYDPDDPERITTQVFSWAPNGLGWTLFTAPFGVIGTLVLLTCARLLLR